jgi:hypothetical protein
MRFTDIPWRLCFRYPLSGELMRSPLENSARIGALHSPPKPQDCWPQRWKACAPTLPNAIHSADRPQVSKGCVTNGVYWLAMKAAATRDAGDAALAAFHAQESARVVVYDFHQFLGGMGMTLEHPLHLWTYRLKLLISEVGGRGANASAAAAALWG